MTKKSTYEELEQRVKSLEKEAVKYRTLFEEARDGIVLTEAETGIIVDCNLETTKLVERKKSEEDKREKRLSLTGKGKKKCEDLRLVRRSWSKAVEKDLSAEEKETLFGLFEKLTHNSKELLDETHAKKKKESKK